MGIGVHAVVSSTQGDRPDQGSVHVVVLLYGSRGDIQPGVCLILELIARGYRVTALVPPNLVEFTRSAGVPHVRSVGSDSSHQWTSEEALESLRSRNPWTRWRFTVDTALESLRNFDDDLVSLFVGTDGQAPAVADVDALVVAPLCQDRGEAIAERLGIPMTSLRFAPMSPNTTYSPLPGIWSSTSPRATLRAWRIFDRVVWMAMSRGVNRFRDRLGLPKARAPLATRLRDKGIRQIQAYDPAVVPTLAQEWGSLRPIVGYLDLPRAKLAGLDEVGAGDERLLAWLAAGDAPLFASFGSLPVAYPATTRDTLRAAAAEHGLRCVFAIGGEPGPDPDDPDVYHVGAVDHAWLLPQCAAAVHHGGAGTTAACMRAGIPSAIYAIAAEQPFWAERVRDLGLGTGRRFSALNPDTASHDVAVLIDPVTVGAARDFAAKMIDPAQAVSTAADVVTSSIGRIPAAQPL